MPKIGTKDPSKSRAKNAAVIETVATSIAKLQELLVQIEDLKQEGFPYRDAMRARVELHVRECVKLVFGDRSPESQQWKHYRVRATSAAEIAETISQLHGLAAQLERKRLELLGIAPPPPVPKQESASSPVDPPLVPAPSSHVDPITPVAVIIPKTVPLEGARTVSMVAVPPAPPPTPSAAAPIQVQTASPPQADSRRERAPSPTQASAPQISPSPASSPTVTRPATPIAPESREQIRDSAIQAEAQTAAPRPLVQSPPEHRDTANPGSATPVPADSLPPGAHAGAAEAEDPLDVVRRVCARFHTIARQLRLRREYRPTLDVEDDRDVQDLLCALLRYELEEVAPQEWTPSYQDMGTALALILPRHRLVVLGKKTKSGVGPREIGHQLTIDAREFSPATGYQSVVCFVYDPEGRIGNPRGLEAELTRVSDSQIVEVIIYPK